MKESDIAISARGLGKQYHIGQLAKNTFTLEDWFVDTCTRVKSVVTRQHYRSSHKKDTFWALKDVSFDIEKGEVVGIIGRNGAGKSTLLKILSRITAPTTGRVEINGRIDSLLEVGTGFHQEMSGRENIYMNAALHGLTKREIDERMEDIIKFSGVEEFLDTPVKYYSSGMGVRLGFAVAAHMDPDILVVDEVLAVGDAEFQKKCMGKMKEVSEGGRTVLFVSHNMGAVRQLCGKTILLSSGKLKRFDSTLVIVNTYLEEIKNKGVDIEKNRIGNGKIISKKTWIEDIYGNVINMVESGSSLKIFMEYEKKEKNCINGVIFVFSLHNSDGYYLTDLGSYNFNYVFSTSQNIGKFGVFIKNLPLNEGNFIINTMIRNKFSLEIYDWVESALVISVTKKNEINNKLLTLNSKSNFPLLLDYDIIEDGNSV